MTRVTAKQLTTVTHLLAKKPETYRAYGPYWWSIKRWMKRENMGAGSLYFLGEYDETETRKIIEKCYPDEQDRFASALQHYEQKVLRGEVTDGSSYLPTPDMSPYQLTDPDLGPANLITSEPFGF